VAFLAEAVLSNGQSRAANNIGLDGAGNVDDVLGSNFGAQARMANESIQEVQVLTAQFDAESGRATGAVINVVTKSGTNRFKGSAFDFLTGRDLTATDYITKVNGLEKPRVSKQEWGATIGGPIVRDALHFFASVERLVQNRSRSQTFSDRPEYSYSNIDDVSVWNTFWRIDHQVDANNTWAFRWLRESAQVFNVLDGPRETPESHDDETDLDQIVAGTFTSVVADNKVNTARVGFTSEHATQANPHLRALDPAYANCTHCPQRMLQDQAFVPPVLAYRSFNAQASPIAGIVLDESYSFDDTFSWFVANKAGRHDVKFGARYTHVWMSNPNNSNANGTYTFRTDFAFNAADPSTYPERFSIRVPGMLDYKLTSDVWELFAQDKWQLRPRLTLSLGVRYDLEIIPIREVDNPFFSDPDAYPVDWNNVSPRLGFIWSPDGTGKSVLRGGYGIFFDRTLFGTIDDIVFGGKYSTSFTATFPQTTADPGPRNGELPTEFVLKNFAVGELTPAVRDHLSALFPPGTVQRNTGTVTWDDPERTQPYVHQITAGYEREVVPGFSVAADYVRTLGRDLFLSPDLNIGTRVDMTPTSKPSFTDPFRVLDTSLGPDEPDYESPVRLITTRYGYSTYDGLNLSIEKRYANNWGLRAAYTLGYARGVALAQGGTPQLQVGTDLNLDEYYAPADSDRRHAGILSGRMEFPRTHIILSGVMRAMSGTPLTIHDTDIDADRNGVPFDPLPAGTYSGTTMDSLQNLRYKGGRNGTYGPGFVQLDMRLGYRARLGSGRTLDLFGEVFNVTNRVNFMNPSGDRRNAADFLRLNRLVGNSGFPRQAQFGARLAF
jgi:hypothetical protein